MLLCYEMLALIRKHIVKIYAFNEKRIVILMQIYIMNLRGNFTNKVTVEPLISAFQQSSSIKIKMHTKEQIQASIEFIKSDFRPYRGVFILYGYIMQTLYYHALFI